MSQPFLGQIVLFPYNFAPRGWAFCNGQILPISQNDALYALVGTTFGGDGQNTFALPDLRGRVPISAGQGPGLSNRVLGQVGGLESATLTAAQLPSHGHTVGASTAAATAASPAGGVPAAKGSYEASANATMLPGLLGSAGGNQPFGVVQPALSLNFCIALEGIFPSRN